LIDDPKSKPEEESRRNAPITKGDLGILLLRVVVTLAIFLPLFWMWQTYVLDPMSGRGRQPTHEELLERAKQQLESNSDIPGGFQ
jgi:hypothetical protein